MGLTFEIKLDNSDQSYFAGQSVSGKVVIKLETRMKVKGVKLKLVGKAKTHWREGHGRCSHTLSETENYMDDKVYLFGYEENIPEVFITEGLHEYPFNFKLPTRIPSSFQGKHGYVKYYLESVIPRSRKFDLRVRHMFTVNGILDLNSEREAEKPVELCLEKNFCCLWCMSGAASFQIKLPRIGHVPGEKVEMMMELANSSSRVATAHLVLMQLVVFHAEGKIRIVTNPITSLHLPRVRPGETISWIDSGVNIPSLPPTKLGGCRLIDLDYFIKVKMSGVGFGLKGRIPLIIGTIPLESRFDHLTSSISEEQRSNSTFSLLGTLRLPAFTDYPDLPPPSYEETVQGIRQDTDDKSDSVPPDYSDVAHGANFVPKYVNYGIQR